MKQSSKYICTFLLSFFCVFTYSQSFIGKYCYTYTDKYEMKTESEIELKADSTYIMKVIVYSSPQYGEVKKIESEENGQLIFENKKIYLKSNDSSSENSTYFIKVTNQKLRIYAVKKNVLSSGNKYTRSKNIILRKNKCVKSHVPT